MLEKATRVSFKTTSHQTKQTFDYIHSNLWGSSRVASHSGAKFFLSIIDNYSKKV